MTWLAIDPFSFVVGAGCMAVFACLIFAITDMQDGE